MSSTGETETSAFVPFESAQRIYFDMLDLLGMLHNASYLLLFERARTDFWLEQRRRHGEDAFDWPYYVAHNAINYHVPIFSNLDVRVTVAVRHLGRTSLRFAHAIYLPDGALSADGETVIVRVDPETKRPIPWSDAFRAMLAPHVRPDRIPGE